MLARLAALEARGAKRATLSVILYLPIIFFAYGFLLGEERGEGQRKRGGRKRGRERRGEGEK